MTTILTAAEGAAVLRVDASDADMLNLLPIVDEFIRGATGRTWSGDTPIHLAAKGAARMLLVMWYENPGQVGNGETLSFGITNALGQLLAEALRYKTFQGLAGVGACACPGARVGDTISTLVGVIGVSGDRNADFESVVTVRDEIQQSSSADLSANFYRAYLTPVEYL